MGIFSFLSDLFGSPNTSSSRAASTPSQGAVDPINPPPYFFTVPQIKEIQTLRSQRPALGLAIASKVASWRLLYQMGSPQAIPGDFRDWIIKAENEKNIANAVAIYSSMQYVLFKNFNNPEAVKRL